MNIHILRRTHRNGFKYEYGPFGEVFCSVGDMAKVNPFQFSTKYTDNETDLLYYRYYSPALGRWLSRDPIEEQGGLNLYGFVNNDPVNAYDMRGLWKIERKGGVFAIATAEPGDTFDDLGRMIKLDTKDYKAWAHTDHNYPKSGCNYRIPNTIFIEFGKQFGNLDIFGPIPKWQRYFKELGKKWEKEDFNVVLTDPSRPELAESHLKSEYIYGFVYAGHGSDFQFVFNGGEGSDTMLDATRYTLYGISFLYAYGCGLANRFPGDGRRGFLHSEWEVNVAKRGYFYGTWGDVNGPRSFKNIIITPGTNTNENKNKHNSFNNI